MQHLKISHYDDFTDVNFDYATDIECGDIYDVLNAMVGALKLMGYCDIAIESAIGQSYFCAGE